MDEDASENVMSVDEEAPPRTKKSAAPAKKTISSTTRKRPEKKAPARPKGKAKKLVRLTQYDIEQPLKIG